MRKLVFSAIMLMIVLLFAVSCVYGGGDEEGYRVMVSASEGASVIGQNPVNVAAGGTVVFEIKITEGYGFVSVSDGEYDAEKGTLTVKNVQSKMNISFVTEELGYDTSKKALFYFIADSVDKASKQNIKEYNYGTEITVSAENFNGIFIGWSLGTNLSGGGKLLTEERVYTFRISPEFVEDGMVKIVANYLKATQFFYDPNGGEIDPDSKNMTQPDGKFYIAELEAGRVKYSFGREFVLYSDVACTFWDDGTFYRDGYVLTEYNTEPDGSGESYSLGSKYHPVRDGEYAVLYCIWSPVSNASDFEYSDASYVRPKNIRAEYAPSWDEAGVVITKYTADEERVTVPEFIDGKPVIGIAKGAFINKSMSTLVLSKNILYVEDGAFDNCADMETVYFSDGIYSINNEAFSSETYASLKNLYVNATIAPRFSNTGDGAFAIKLSKLLSTSSKNRIIVIAGSSSYQGLGSKYLEALLDGEYAVVNFGTTRTTHGTIYLEAMQKLAHDGDVIVYAPENSSYMLGEPELYWKTLRDLEGMYNFFRYIDISNYTNFFSAFSDLNQNYRYTRPERIYEDICFVPATDADGDFQNEKRANYVTDKYIDAYYVTFNNRVKSKYDLNWNDVAGQEQNKDYSDPNNITWCSIDDPYYTKLVNHSISAAKRSGATVLFGFAPTDVSAIVPEALNREWLLAYDKLILDTYEFDGLLGSSVNFIYAHEYFYDCAFHTNDYGRTYRTYHMYLQLIKTLDIDSAHTATSLGRWFPGCLFEENPDKGMYYPVDIPNGGGQ